MCCIQRFICEQFPDKKNWLFSWSDLLNDLMLVTRQFTLINNVQHHIQQTLWVTDENSCSLHSLSLSLSRPLNDDTVQSCLHQRRRGFLREDGQARLDCIHYPAAAAGGMAVRPRGLGTVQQQVWRTFARFRDVFDPSPKDPRVQIFCSKLSFVNFPWANFSHHPAVS